MGCRAATPTILVSSGALRLELPLGERSWPDSMSKGSRAPTSLQAALRAGRTTRSGEDKLDEGVVRTSASSHSVRGIGDEWTFAVTLVRPGPAVPVFEVGAYRYTGVSLPHVGDIVTITKATTDAEQRAEMLAYVTRVDPTSETPIRVTEATGVTSTSPDDFIAPA